MEHEEIATRLARIETKLDVLLEDRKRLTDVERRQWYHSGGVAVLALVLTKFGIPLFPNH